MNGGWTFLTGFLRNPVGVGAICPSSRILARAMTHGLELLPGETVIELGPGTGAFTGYIDRIIPNSDDYLGIEQDVKFVEVLNDQFPDLRVIVGQAENTHQIHHNSGRKPVKAIISSIPFAAVKDNAQIKIVADLRQLLPTGSIFRTFQYLHTYRLPLATRFRRRMDGITTTFYRSRLVMANIPPAFVLTWIV